MRTLIATLSLAASFSLAIVHAVTSGPSISSPPGCGVFKTIAVCQWRDDRAPAADMSPCVFVKSSAPSAMACSRPVERPVTLSHGG